MPAGTVAEAMAALSENGTGLGNGSQILGSQLLRTPTALNTGTNRQAPATGAGIAEQHRDANGHCIDTGKP